jgi:tRNA(Arg) A34 adenosine deaminase TadA
MKEHQRYLKMAIEEASSGIRNGDGGPFGAIIVRNGKVIGKGHNCVLSTHDPTAHAEIIAIRQACAREGEPHLTGAILYTNFEPCPMCLAASYWAHIHQLYFCSGREVAEEIGFMDRQLYNEFARKPERRKLQASQIRLPEMDPLLEEWKGLEGKLLY